GLLMAGFDGLDLVGLPDDLPGTLAGVILFKRNLHDRAQVRALTDMLYDAWAGAQAARRGAPGPLIAVDQEGGTVSRLSGIGTTTPSAMALGATGDPMATHSMYGIIGRELSALGFNCDFAPVADVNNDAANPVIGIRAFGEQPAQVAQHVAAAVRGLHAAGIAATAKHFPGHGDTTVDSHHALPEIAHDLERLRTIELPPFRAAIEAGVDAIMTAHILFPALAGDGAPATLSRPVLTGLLRQELGFEGVICTDCMEMHAIESGFAPERSAVMAVAAGADLVLFSHQSAKLRTALQALQRALDEGELDPAQLEDSLRRVERLRARVTQQRLKARGAADLSGVGGPQHQAAALAIARRAVTVVRDPQSLLPIRIEAGQRAFVVYFGADSQTPVEDAGQLGKQRTTLGKFLADLGAKVHEQTRTLDPAGHEYKQLLMASASADLIVAVTTRARLHPLQARAVADLMMLGKAVIAIAAREPYDATVLPAEMPVIAAFGDDPHALHAAAEVLTGAAVAAGRLPVTV
ncbi:MAG: glycoside hydrolase family 3 protein, partial [Candidatus Eremiobacteraeota bacterium]|nr:glycoside hydrolase family 3 protein [Candidatus Eremiobacteraeota bacterium]